jgi:small-conductance mechanosensitive channel
LDKIAERVGATQILTDAGWEPSASRLIARIVYWIILLVFVLGAAESLGLRGVVNTLEGLIAYLPSVLAAALIVLIGSLIARVVGDAVGALAAQAGVSAGAALGQAVRYVLLAFVIILALEQLGIETTLLTTVATALITATALALALAFGLGSRDLASNIMAGLHAKESFSVGQQVDVSGHIGRLASIGPVKTVIETEAGMVSLPNSVLTDDAVTVTFPGEGP